MFKRITFLLAILVLTLSSGCVSMSAHVKANVKADQGVIEDVEFGVHIQPQGAMHAYGSR